MTRRICVVTGSRAEYGLLRWLIQDIRAAADLTLHLIATGMHLSPEFGLTYREIEADGVPIDRKLDVLLSSDSAASVAKSMGLGLIAFADAFQQLRPDLLLVVGDRFEIFAAVAAALVARIPVAHVHGGEITVGAFDEALRHSITKMAHLHFVAAEEYRRRVIQLGEDPQRVFVVGGLGLDGMKRLELLERTELEAALGLELGAKNLLITFHPTTLGDESAQQLTELLAALDALTDTQLIFTLPNADTDGRALAGMIERFVVGHTNAHLFASLGQTRYLSCLRHLDGVVGNSSSGLTEAPSFAIGTVNIGDRQRGRLRAASVIDCAPERQAIAAALRQLYSTSFRAKLRHVRNPYGEPGASERIVAVLRSQRLEMLVKKHFYDLPELREPAQPKDAATCD
jgi:GDP/UDP-N,N'-diacetylbacillosamine 2-epimerase (hydrolysing)